VGRVQRHEISHHAHAHHPLMAPVSDATVDRVLDRLLPTGGGRLLDLGCGRGEWIHRALTARAGLTAVGVDLHPGSDPEDFARDLGGRAHLVEADASTWADGSFDVVLAVGVSHVFGGPDATLDAVRRHLAPGGRALLGDGIWDAPPTPAALAALDATPEEVPDLAALLDLVGQHGFEVAHGHVSSLEEWDEYEWSWTGSLAQWALADGRDPGDRAQALEASHAHRDAWLRGYRGVLGFATLVLVDALPTRLS
jgi:SAM-dependent methyltransferase